MRWQEEKQKRSFSIDLRANEENFAQKKSINFRWYFSAYINSSSCSSNAMACRLRRDAVTNDGFPHERGCWQTFSIGCCDNEQLPVQIFFFNDSLSLRLAALCSYSVESSVILSWYVQVTARKGANVNWMIATMNFCVCLFFYFSRFLPSTSFEILPWEVFPRSSNRR